MAYSAFVGVLKDPLFTVTTAPVPVGVTLSIAVTGLPPGLVYNTVTKTVGGTPTVVGRYVVNITVTPSDTQIIQVASIDTVIDVLLNIRINVRGTIKDGNNAPFSGVTVKESATNTSTVTDVYGAYSLQAPYSTEGIVITPRSNTYQFTPSSITLTSGNVDITGQNFVGALLQPPLAPTITGIISDSQTLTVNITPPNNEGRAVITNYSYSLNGGTTWTTRSPASILSPLTITGLTNNTSYSVKVRAINTVGYGAASNAVTATPALAHEHSHSYNIAAYWSDDSPLVNGSILYVAQVTNTRALNVTFFSGLDQISTNDTGLVSITFRYNHSTHYTNNENTLTYWSDKSTLNNKDILYTGEHTDVVAANISEFFYGLFTVKTNSVGAVTKTYTYNFPNPHGAYWSLDRILVNGSSILYTAQNNNTPAANIQPFDEGLFRISTDGFGKVSTAPIYSTQYPHGKYWSNVEVLVDGVSYLYTVQYGNDKAKNVTLFNEGLRTVRTDGNGLVILDWIYNHPTPYGAYWGDNATLNSGNFLYTEQHNNVLAGDKHFELNGYVIDTNVNGVVSKTAINHVYAYPPYHWSSTVNVSSDLAWSDSYLLAAGNNLYASAQTNTHYTAFNKIVLGYAAYLYNDTISGVTAVNYGGLYPHGTYWSPDATLVLGSAIYTKTNDTTYALAVNASFTYISEPGISRAVQAGNDAKVTNIVNTYNHPTPYGAYWGNYTELYSGDILYTSKTGNTVANNATAFTYGIYTVTTDANGVVSMVLTIDHQYAHGAYWSDAATLSLGVILYTGRYVNTPASSKSFAEGLYTVQTNPLGAITGYAYTLNHPNPQGSYWSDDVTLTSGSSVLYMEQHTNALVVNARFDLAGYTITTNANGIVTKSTIDHMYAHGAYWGDFLSLETGYVLFTGRYTNALATNADFNIRIAEFVYRITTGVNGVVTKAYLYNHAYQFGSYYGDSQTLATGSSFLYTDPHKQIRAVNVSAFTLNGYSISTNASGVVTYTAV